jgi:hypothetical protein
MDAKRYMNPKTKGAHAAPMRMPHRTERACGIILSEVGYQQVESEARENGER